MRRSSVNRGSNIAPLVAALLAGIAGFPRASAAQTGIASAPLTDIRYGVTFTSANAARRFVTSAMTFTVGGDLPVILSLPVWTPGAYEMSNFARNVFNFSAEQSGATLSWDKLDQDTWRIQPRGVGQVMVRFDYRADSLENENSWAQSDFLLFNGTNLFLYPEGRSLDFPATVSVTTEPAWKIVTGMISTGPRTYTASNYHDLVDMPFFVGRFDVDSTLISERWIRFATYPAGSVSGAQRSAVWDAFGKVIPPQVKVFGEVPWSTYTVLQIVDSSFAGGAGLEHQNSHVDILAPEMIGSPVLISLYAHEVFHAWNVKRLRPAELYPYRYDQPQLTTQLWISEGITDYYSDLAQVRGGTVDARGFYDLITEKIAEVAALPPTALEDASLSTWIHPRDGTEYLYYPKGSLAGLMLDILIRDATDNRASLDHVMRAMYNSVYKEGRGFTSDEWWSVVSRAANGKSFEDFNARYVNGREPYPWDKILPLAGMRLGGDLIREPRVGISTIQDSTGVYVTDPVPGTPALPPGLKSGDLLLAVGGVSVDDAAWLEKFRARYARAAEGAEVPIRIRRDGRPQTVAVRLHFVARVDPRVVEEPRASARARRIREGLLRGTTRQ